MPQNFDSVIVGAGFTEEEAQGVIARVSS